eukprot:CAMPEP_0172480198 /NCGR_PEP_ID=MMETSP1066-20121228/5233_1 /TAXON_ID=671091 /ORGANISM="Coscinodiscus wailesii, Strain CCMP2513" /LENGTH=178 /DNA_ID=CAMNT_0013241321 /DNA_START=314 /DNA_END=847 /DNA_ORIENTATION=+
MYFVTIITPGKSNVHAAISEGHDASIHPAVLTRQLKRADVRLGKYPLTDYNGTHRFEIMERRRSQLAASQRSRVDAGRETSQISVEEDEYIIDEFPQFELEDPNIAKTEMRYNRDLYRPIRIRANYMCESTGVFLTKKAQAIIDGGAKKVKEEENKTIPILQEQVTRNEDAYKVRLLG